MEGSFESALHYLFGNEIDLSDFDTSYSIDIGARVYAQEVMLKIVSLPCK